MRKVLGFLKLTAFLLSLMLATGVMAYLSTEEVSGRAVVLDGDSIRLNGVEIRLFGIDAPEGRQECRSADGSGKIACGRNAREYLKKLTRSGGVSCKGNEYDKFDRLLAVCRANGMEINAEMVLAGHAVAFGAYEQEEARARAGRKGLWSGQFDQPRDWRRNSAEKHQSGFLSRLFNW